MRFTNYCQHPSRDDKFGPGIIGILGPNGSGKSNYLKGIKRAFTGQTDNAGKNEDDLLWGAESGTIQVDFVAGTEKGHIKRNLKSASCNMKFGEDSFKSATAIDAKIYDILGFTEHVLSKVVFIPQGEIEKVLFVRPSERAKEMQALFKTENAEDIRTLLQDQLNTLTAVSQADVIKAKEAESVKLYAEWHVLSQELQKFKLLTPEEAAAHNHTLAVGQAYQSHAAVTASIVSEHKAELERQGNLHLVVGEAEAKHKKLAEPVESLKDYYQQVQSRIGDYQVNKANFSSRQIALFNLRKAEETIKSEAPVVKGVNPARLAEVILEMEKLLPGIQVAQQVLAAVGGKQVCPTCLQPVDAAFVEKHRQIHQTSNPRYRELQAERQQLEQDERLYEAEMARFQERVASAKIMRSVLEKQLAGLPDVPEPDSKQLASDQDFIKEYEETRRIMMVQQRDLDIAKANLDNCIANVLRLENRLAEHQKTAVESVSQEAIQAASSALVANHEHEVKHAAVGTKMDSLAEQKRLLDNELVALREAEGKVKPTLAFKNMCERSRMILHRDRLPNMVAQAFIKAINQKLGAYIELFEVPFTVKIEPDLSIRCFFGGNREAMAERLSGGQKVMLGIAFRFAIYDLFVNNLGFMVLDEPTVYLDHDRIEGVFDLLQKVKGYSQSAGLQLIVVTHEARLQGVFDQTIRLGT